MFFHFFHFLLFSLLYIYFLSSFFYWNRFLFLPNKYFSRVFCFFFVESIIHKKWIGKIKMKEFKFEYECWKGTTTTTAKNGIIMINSWKWNWQNNEKKHQKTLRTVSWNLAKEISFYELRIFKGFFKKS